MPADYEVLSDLCIAVEVPDGGAGIAPAQVVTQNGEAIDGTVTRTVTPESVAASVALAVSRLNQLADRVATWNSIGLADTPGVAQSIATRIRNQLRDALQSALASSLTPQEAVRINRNFGEFVLRRLDSSVRISAVRALLNCTQETLRPPLEGLLDLCEAGCPECSLWSRPVVGGEFGHRAWVLTEKVSLPIGDRYRIVEVDSDAYDVGIGFTITNYYTTDDTPPGHALACGFAFSGGFSFPPGSLDRQGNPINQASANYIMNVNQSVHFVDTFYTPVPSCDPAGERTDVGAVGLWDIGHRAALMFEEVLEPLGYTIPVGLWTALVYRP